MSEQQKSLLPCPFCGGDARADSHADDCYFTLHRALNKASDGDASLQLEVLEAWNRRAAIEARAAVPAGWVPVDASLRDKNWNHPNDHEPRTAACREALKARGDDEGQGLDSFWKWGFAAGFNAALAAAPQPVAQPSEQSEGIKGAELDHDSNDSITGQQRGMARALEVGQRVVQSRKQGRSDPDAEKELNLIVKALAAPIAVEVAKNCRSVPQLTFPHIALGLTDLILSVTQSKPEQAAQPMTPAQREDAFRAAESAMDSDINLSWRHALVKAVERHHGITASPKD